MARGNQRDRDGERAQARASNKPKNPKDDGLTPDNQQGKERDAKAPQEKAVKKATQERDSKAPQEKAVKKATQALAGDNANVSDHSKNKKKK